MATIRIADVPHPKSEYLRPNLQDGVTSSGGDGIYGRRSFSRSDASGLHDDIYNIRSRSRGPSTNRRGSRSRMSMTDREDDDPGLRTPGDFKEKQVPTEPMANSCGTSISFLVDIQGKVASVAFLSVNRSHLWRHWHQSSLRLLVDIQLGAFTSRSHWSALDNHLEPVYDGDGEVRDGHSPCG
jgi:hypothetical protein